MAQFVLVPVEQLAEQTLQSLLEEYASRDGTEYGELEVSLSAKVEQLKVGLQQKTLCLLFDVDGEHWDLMPAQDAEQLLVD